MAITRFNPTREIADFEREISRFFNSFGDRLGVTRKEQDNAGYENAVWAPLTDISENKDSFILDTDLPGVKKDDVKISYNNGQITISGERKYESEDEDEKHHRVERAFGKYYRSFNLPKEIQPDKISAEYKDGSLKVTVPKAEEAKPKEIEIQVN